MRPRTTAGLCNEILQRHPSRTGIRATIILLLAPSMTPSSTASEDSKLIYQLYTLLLDYSQYARKKLESGIRATTIAWMWMCVRPNRNTRPSFASATASRREPI
uniref:Uncharacterized protein n=1 Tax=Trichogramma kaykai TaxID=54128 RepID=A0ABD2X589_9HYME